MQTESAQQSCELDANIIPTFQTKEGRAEDT